MRFTASFSIQFTVRGDVFVGSSGFNGDLQRMCHWGESSLMLARCVNWVGKHHSTHQHSQEYEYINNFKILQTAFRVSVLLFLLLYSHNSRQSNKSELLVLST